MLLKGREEATAAEELMRTTERKICEIKQNTAIRFKDMGMFINQVPKVEERKHKLRVSESPDKSVSIYYSLV